MPDFSSAIWNKPAAAAAAADDPVTKSLRFNADDTPSLYRTFSAGNSTKWTLSFWYKRSVDGDTDYIFNTGAGGWQGYSGGTNNGSNLNIGAIYMSGDKVGWYNYDPGTGASSDVLTLAVLRDAASFYHIVMSYDGGQSTRLKVYINGEIQTLDSGAVSATSFFNTAQVHSIGFYGGNTSSLSARWPYMHGFLSDMYWLDGTGNADFSSYTNPAHAFAEEDSTTGQWKPKAASGLTYGTNGFHLEMKETGTGTASSSTIGADTSGEDNHFTTHNLAASDVVNDRPTDNYCVLNPLNVTGSFTFSEGNLKVSGAILGANRVTGTLGASSRKWYFEFKKESSESGENFQHWGVYDPSVALGSGGSALASGNATASEWVFADDGVVANNGTGSASGLGGVSQNDIVQIAIDMDTSKFWVGLNNTWDGDPAAGTGAAYSNLPATVVPFHHEWGTGKATLCDFGQSDFAHTPPTGFSALSTGNLPTPTIAKPSEHFDVLTYASSGAKTFDNGTTSMQPDLVWVKARGNAYDHELTDSVRGVTKALSSNASNVESTDSTGLTAFGSDGFTVGAGTNYSTSAMVAWCWKAGTSFEAESGVSGSGSKNPTAGFSIATWTGDDDDESSTYQTIAHGLGVVPEMIIAKGRTDNTDEGSHWFVYHKDLDSNYYLLLNSTDGGVDAYLDVIDNIGTSSADFGTEGSFLNFNYGGSDVEYEEVDADTYVAYFFASVEGYSKIGSYVGTGTASTAPFIYTGFRPAYVMHKEIDTSSYNWVIHDSARDPFNDASWNHLIADRSDEENGSETGPASGFADFVSNGFNLNSASTEHGNGSGKTYIYYAVAEKPLKYASAR